MTDRRNILTKSAFQNLKDELQELKVVKRKEIAAKIKVAREQGDLSENAEYDAAKDEQRDIEARIDELEELLRTAEIVDNSEIDFEKVHLGCKVTVENDMAKKTSYQIVSHTEIDALKGKISGESPIGKAIMGKALGDKVEVTLPNGNVLHLKIIDIVKTEEV